MRKISGLDARALCKPVRRQTPASLRNTPRRPARDGKRANASKRRCAGLVPSRSAPGAGLQCRGPALRIVACGSRLPDLQASIEVLSRIHFVVDSVTKIIYEGLSVDSVPGGGEPRRPPKTTQAAIKAR